MSGGLREDGVQSLVESAVRLGLPADRVRELLREQGFTWTVETVKKKMREAARSMEG